MDNQELAGGYNGAKPKGGQAIMGELSGNTGQVGGSKVARKAGLYRHPLTGAELITQHDPLYGDGQSRAAERVGFVFVREVEPDEIKTLGTPSQSHAEQPERAVETSSAELAELRARLAALEAAQSAPAVAPEVPGAEATKQAAAEKAEAQTGTAVDPATGATAAEPETGEPTYAELRAEAKELGVSAKGSKEELTQRVAEANAEKGNN